MTLYKGNKVIAGSRSYIGNIGDIKYTTRVDLPFGGSWCDGSIKLKAQFPTVYQMLIDGKLQALDIATYESALNLNGSCGFFGLDTATESFRVPSLNDVYIKSGQVADEFGAESLPNISGSFLSLYESNGVNGDFKYTDRTGTSTAVGGGYTTKFVEIDNPTYQDGAKVNPDHVKYRAYVVLYTGADTNIDITKEIQLNNPFSFGMSQWLESDPKNASWLLSDGAFHSGDIYESFYNWLLSILNGEAVEGVSVKSSTDTYGDYDYVVNTADTTFRLPIKVKLASGNAVVGNGNAMALTTHDSADPTSTIGTHYFFESSNNSSFTGNSELATKPLKAGTTAGEYGGFANNYLIGLSPNPSLSGIETSSSGLKLYFYVGETVQDANLINASKVLDLLAKLESYDYVVESKTPTAEDPTWYRKYKSGWIEQGGVALSVRATTTVNFLKSYSIAPSVVCTEYWNENTTNQTIIKQISLTNFVLHNDHTSATSTNATWYACGQGA